MSFDDWMELVYPDHRERVAREFNVLRERDSYDVEYMLLTPSENTNGVIRAVPCAKCIPTAVSWCLARGKK